MSQPSQPSQPSQSPAAPQPSSATDGVPANWRAHLYTLLTLNTCNHIQNSGGRFAVVLFAVHQQASPLLVGVLMGLHSLVPALTSVHIGRMLDRAPNIRSLLLISAVITSAGALLPFFWESLAALFIFSVVNGSAYNVFRIGSQQLTGRYGTAADRPAHYNLYSQGLAGGNLVAPLIGGFAIDYFGFRYAFLVLAVMALPAVLVCASGRHYLPPAEHLAARASGGDAPRRSIWSLLRIPMLRRVLIAGVALMSVWDMFTFAWPQYGAQLRYAASEIGIVASVFYAGTFVVRALATVLLRRFTQWQLLILAMLISSGLFIGFPLLSSLPALGALAFVLGLVLGIIQPMTMALVYDEAPADRKGEVIGLRLTLAFSLHIAIPLLAGALASVLGLAVIWGLSAATLLAGCWVSRGQWNYRRESQAA